jgi:DNA polymerase III subunit beta
MPVEAAVAAETMTMEITVSKFELLRELTATQGVVERKTTIPILSNYLFEARRPVVADCDRSRSQPAHVV